MSENHQILPDAEERQLPEFNAMQRVKRRFFAMRNGLLAEQMKRHGAQYKINFGLNLPQIMEIARDFLPGGCEDATLPEEFDRADMARRLRANDTTRESMLIAPMLFPVEQLTVDEAIEWASTAPTAEVVDILCMKLLRNHPDALSIATTLLSALASAPVPTSASAPDSVPASVGSDLSRYAGLRLLMNLVQLRRVDFGKAVELAKREEARACALTSPLCLQIYEEVEFLSMKL